MFSFEELLGRLFDSDYVTNKLLPMVKKFDMNEELKFKAGDSIEFEQIFTIGNTVYVAKMDGFILGSHSSSDEPVSYYTAVAIVNVPVPKLNTQETIWMVLKTDTGVTKKQYNDSKVITTKLTEGSEFEEVTDNSNIISMFQKK